MELNDVVMPIDVDMFQELLIEAAFDETKRSKLIDEFRHRFDIGYRGPLNRKNKSSNLPSHCGNETEMWAKVMKEVSLNRYSGPFEEDQIPYDYYIQSPIGLVPKSGGKTRLIFHLSYNFSESERSLNECTPRDFCSVKYKDLDYAILGCPKLLEKCGHSVIYFGKTDLVSAFRILPIRPDQRNLLMMKARHPVLQKFLYFADKCLPFGSSISCAHFQLFSDALAAILESKLKVRVTNYLDDFLFMSSSEEETNRLVRTFLDICNKIGCPVSEEKTEWSSDCMVFLGILLDGKNHLLAMPQEKKVKTTNMLQLVLSKKKVTIKEAQRLTGLLNFQQRVIVPGRTFTRSMYNKLRIKDK